MYREGGMSGTHGNNYFYLPFSPLQAGVSTRCSSFFGNSSLLKQAPVPAVLVSLVAISPRKRYLTINSQGNAFFGALYILGGFAWWLAAKDSFLGGFGMFLVVFGHQDNFVFCSAWAGMCCNWGERRGNGAQAWKAVSYTSIETVADSLPSLCSLTSTLVIIWCQLSKSPVVRGDLNNSRIIYWGCAFS